MILSSYSSPGGRKGPGRQHKGSCRMPKHGENSAAAENSAAENRGGRRKIRELRKSGWEHILKLGWVITLKLWLWDRIPNERLDGFVKIARLSCHLSWKTSVKSDGMFRVGGEHKSSLKPLSLSTGSRQYTGCHRKDHMHWSTCLPDRWKDLIIPLLKVIGS